MPVQFLNPEQRANFGRYVGTPTIVELARYFHLDDADIQHLASKRGEHSRLGYAVQLTTVRYLGRFLDDVSETPPSVLNTLVKQMGLADARCLSDYRDQRQRFRHIEEICLLHGYQEITNPLIGFRLARWLYLQCWTGTDRPIVLFDRATSWLFAHKVLLPGASTLERFVAKLRQRVEQRVWHLLGRGVSLETQGNFDALLSVPDGNRRSLFDQLRSGPTYISGPSLVSALNRLDKIRNQGVIVAPAGSIPASRIAALARFASRAKVTALSRLSKDRRLATMVACMQTLEASAQDDALEILENLLRDIFGSAEKADRKARLRTLRDLDAATLTLADTCALLLDIALPDSEVRSNVFAKISRSALELTLKNAYALIRPQDNVFYSELHGRYKRVRIFLPMLLKHIRFCAAPAGEPVVAAFDYLKQHYHRRQFDDSVPMLVVNKAWQRYVVPDAKDKTIDPRAYTFCVLDRLRIALKHRDVFVTPSWRYADPRRGMLAGSEWESTRPMVCRTLGLSADSKPVLAELASELDQTYRAVIARLPNNPAVRFEGTPGEEELILSPLEKINEPDTLVALRTAVAARIPRVDLPEIILEIATRTGFTDAFSHVSEQSARVTGLSTSLCAVLLAEACNTGIEPLIVGDVAALRRDRLTWVNQNYLRDETLVAANATLVAAQNGLALARAWGGGEVASADGMRFVVPVKTVHAGANPKYFGAGRGVTYYNMVSDQFTGLHAITVPGTLRDSLVLLAVVLGQETELQPMKIMTDTGAYSDVMFGLFRLLGYRFSPRLADVGDTRFWRIDPDADYGSFNGISQKRKINLELIAAHWDDLLRLVGSLKLGKVSPANIMRILQTGDSPTQLAKALAEFGRIDKTIHILNYIDDEDKRRDTLIQLNRGESRHSLAREVFHGKRGELQQRYREGQEDQLGSLGLVTNVIILWNTIYIQASLDQLRKEGFAVLDDDVARLSPLIHAHINMLGRYSFAMPESVARGELRPLRDPNEDA